MSAMDLVAETRPTPAVPQTVLSTKGLDVGYGPVQVLFGVDFEVARGEMVALLGTNGAGKSTLLKAICGLLKPKRGKVDFNGASIVGQPADKVAHAGIAMMPGGKGVFPTLTVAENLRLAGWLIRKDPQRVAAAKTQIEELFPILRERSTQLAGDLSGGEQQMLALGMALTTKPELLLIDELSLGLAPTVVGQLLEVVQAIHAGGTTIVIVEQSVNVALELAQRAVFMEKGEVRFEGLAVELLERPDILRSVFIAGAAGLEAESAGPDEAADSQPQATVPAQPVRDADARRRELVGAPEVLACREVVKTFGGIRAVDNTSMSVRKGEILGLIGHNGAGKTTLLDCISGFHQIDRGHVVLRGHDVTDWVPNERARGGLGRSFQDALLYPTLSVAETIAVARERHVACRDLLAEALRLPASYESELAIWAKVEELVELMGLGAYREKHTGELSTGTRRIVDIACILAQEPSVLLLDEPSGGVAQRETEALGPLLLRVRQHTDCSIVVVEHDMPLLQAICDRMVALELGAPIAEGTPAEVLEHPAVIESYLGTSEVAIARSGTRGRADATEDEPDAPGPIDVEEAGWLDEPYGAHQAHWGDDEAEAPDPVAAAGPPTLAQTSTVPPPPETSNGKKRGTTRRAAASGGAASKPNGAAKRSAAKASNGAAKGKAGSSNGAAKRSTSSSRVGAKPRSPKG